MDGKAWLWECEAAGPITSAVRNKEDKSLGSVYFPSVHVVWDGSS